MVLATIFFLTNRHSVGDVIDIMPADFTLPEHFSGTHFMLGRPWIPRGHIENKNKFRPDAALNTRAGRATRTLAQVAKHLLHRLPKVNCISGIGRCHPKVSYKLCIGRRHPKASRTFCVGTSVCWLLAIFMRSEVYHVF